MIPDVRRYEGGACVADQHVISDVCVACTWEDSARG